ncbi:MAG: MFS transporter [Anaerolineae bacterium]|nr:MFS transporter [Candidatus Roseilinea sp.]MDW8449644.1 MFS transporter [Anaerolineae bacterium]
MGSSTVVPAGEAQATRAASPAAQTAGYFLAFVGLGLFAALMGPTLSGLAANTRVTLGEISVLFPVRSFGYLLGSLAGGRLYDRVRGHPVIAVAFVVTALAMAVAPAAQQLWLLAAAFFVASVAEGMVDVGGNTLMVWVHGAKVGPFMNALHFFFGLGTFVAPLVVAQVIASSGGRIAWAYWLIALTAIAPVLWHLRVPSPAHPAVAYDPANARSHTRTGLALLMAVFFFLYVGMEIAFGGWIASYAVAIGYGDAAAAAVLTSAFWGAFMLGRLLSVPLATRLRPQVVMLLDFALCTLGIGLFLLGSRSPLLLWAGVIVVGLGMAALFPTMISFAESRMRITGGVTAIFLAGSSLGGMTLPWLIGQLFEPVGPQVMPWVVLICTLATGLTFALVNAVSRPRPARPN